MREIRLRRGRVNNAYQDKLPQTPRYFHAFVITLPLFLRASWSVLVEEM